MRFFIPFGTFMRQERRPTNFNAKLKKKWIIVSAKRVQGKLKQNKTWNLSVKLNIKQWKCNSSWLILGDSFCLFSLFVSSECRAPQPESAQVFCSCWECEGGRVDCGWSWIPKEETTKDDRVSTTHIHRVKWTRCHMRTHVCFLDARLRLMWVWAYRCWHYDCLNGPTIITERPTRESSKNKVGAAGH